jgi:glycolate oxidase FAD binding subunit
MKDMSKADNPFSRLKEITGEANINQDPDVLKTYALDGKRPRAIVSPGTIDEVSKIVSLANQQHFAIIPMGNGTKMAIGGIPKKMDIILSTRRLNRISDCDTDNLTLSVESGITLDEVQKRLGNEGKGYFLPLDSPFTHKATLGGIVATNSSGPERMLYGTVRDLIIGIKAVFPNGDIVATGGKTVKNVSGYDMGKLLTGSYGTLGIICEMTFKLLPLPEKEATFLAFFLRLEDADKFVNEILRSQLLPASIEILNGLAMKKLKYPMSVSTGKNYLAAIGLEGVAESIDRQVSEMGEIGKKNRCLEISVLNSERHHSFWLAVRDIYEGLVEDHSHLVSLKSNFVISKYAEVLGSYEKIGKEFGMDCAFICHSGTGILYSYVFVGKNVRSKAESLIELIKRFTSEAVKHEGNLVVESSPLLIKKRIGVWGEPRSDCEVMRRLKEQIDPGGILNPGRFVGGI